MANENPTISKITLPSGNTYDLKDASARSDIEDLRSSISGGVHYLGTTTTELTDGSTTSVIVISGNSHTAANGDMVNYQSKEFVWDGSKWQEMGDMGAFGALAYKDNASATYTPAGSVSQPTFTGSSFSSTGSFTPSGSVTISTGTGTANYTPSGTVSQPSFTGSSFSSTGTYQPEGSVTISASSTGTANYTPEGSVSTPTITVTPSTGTVNSITAVGTSPSWSAVVNDEDLSFTWSAGTLPTKGSDTTVVTGISSATATQPTFTGTGAVLTGSFSGTSKSVSVSGTPTGTVSQPTFTGTGAELKATFNGTSGSVSVSGTPTGTVSQPTFTGTQATITVS